MRPEAYLLGALLLFVLYIILSVFSRIMTLLIPKGDYCYTNGKTCPYWSLRPDKPLQRNGYCSFLGKGDWELNGEKQYKNVKTGEIQTGDEIGIPMSLLWDKCKECGVNEYTDEEFKTMWNEESEDEVG